MDAVMGVTTSSIKIERPRTKGATQSTGYARAERTVNFWLGAQHISGWRPTGPLSHEAHRGPAPDRATSTADTNRVSGRGPVLTHVIKKLGKWVDIERIWRSFTIIDTRHTTIDALQVGTWNAWKKISGILYRPITLNKT
jgi:hypothetical protein